MKHETIVVLDFGGQLNQLVARRIRQLGVYCEVLPASSSLEIIKEIKPIGIVLTGFDQNFTNHSSLIEILKLINVPVLAIGFAAQLIIHSSFSELEPVVVNNNDSIKIVNSELFSGVKSNISAWVVDFLAIKSPLDGFKMTACDSNGVVFAMENVAEKFYLLQFNPEISETEDGTLIIRNFLYNICKATGDWSMKDYAEKSIATIREQVGNGKVLLALSGGVDSSVVASLLGKAIGSQLYCIFVDHGFMRKNEGDEVAAAFCNGGINFIRVDAEARFLSRLKGVSDPETKRKIIGEEFIRVFEEEAKKIGKVDFFAQGTIYPDVIESDIGDGSVIKSHHNVGGLPEHVDFKDIIEPLRLLFKDEVRLLGSELGIPDYLVWRQPFPGPGLAIRVIGEITKEKLDMLRDADFIFREEIKNSGFDKQINQFFAVLTNMRSVGVYEDVRTYDYTLALRGVVTNDFMTANWARIPYDLLDKVSKRIVKEVAGINRIVYDITSKPPATIEWE